MFFAHNRRQGLLLSLAASREVNSKRVLSKFMRLNNDFSSGYADPCCPQGRPQVQIEISRGRARDLMREVVGSAYLIGSARDCDLVLGDAQFPEVYAYLYVNDSGVTLRHLDEGPEMTVDGVVVRSVSLTDGSRIRTGPFEFRIHINNASGRRTRKDDPEDVLDHFGVEAFEDERAVLEIRQLLSQIRNDLAREPFIPSKSRLSA